MKSDAASILSRGCSGIMVWKPASPTCLYEDEVRIFNPSIEKVRLFINSDNSMSFYLNKVSKLSKTRRKPFFCLNNIYFIRVLSSFGV